MQTIIQWQRYNTIIKYSKHQCAQRAAEIWSVQSQHNGLWFAKFIWFATSVNSGESFKELLQVGNDIFGTK